MPLASMRRIDYFQDLSPQTRTALRRIGVKNMRDLLAAPLGQLIMANGVGPVSMIDMVDVSLKHLFSYNGGSVFAERRSGGGACAESSGFKCKRRRKQAGGGMR